MRAARVYRNDIYAGTVIEHADRSFTFTYDDAYFADVRKPALSPVMPKTQRVYRSDHLFSTFANLLSEGSNREVQSRWLRIDERDDFGILLATAHTDVVGALTFREVKNVTV